ncbi:protein LEAD-SENSITIVE 1-like [Magnolia sinica]|uniref:protein LEAD-SENSITIVE 1-like n=1 Tax=Magnolia sinica TaxID=86752 RepID=UPI0026585445|nr:protein LEAD-SENSITIVE 1-like [Magnolia sinica]
MSSLIEPFTGQEIQRWQLKPGDHIYTWRAFVYGHHGIYMGDEKVIQFSFARGQIPEVLEAVIHLLIRKKPCNKCGGLLNRTSNGVLITCLDCFLAGGKIYRYRYSISDHERRNMRAGTREPEHVPRLTQTRQRKSLSVPNQ